MADMIEQLKAEEKVNYEIERETLFSEDSTERMKQRLGAESILRVEVAPEPERNNNGYAWAIVGILAFMLFTGGNFPALYNLWALLLLVPGVKQLQSVWKYGVVNRQGRNNLLGGAILTYIALTFLVGLSWGMFGPMILIILAWLHFQDQPRHA